MRTQNTQMSLEEYKKQVEICLMKKYPNITEEERMKVRNCLTATKEYWEQLMQDFSPEEMIVGRQMGLI